MSRKAPVSQSVFVRVTVKQKRTEIIEEREAVLVLSLKDTGRTKSHPS